MLFGPGSFLVAHTDREHLKLDELDAADRRLRAVADGVSQLARYFFVSWSRSAVSIVV